ncbi:hypothetical protein BgAZ_403840 [Babesia gibsoni]|uniref:Mediator of RNA polymerase II transcription subunit 6 n=1 Tax=Babesia gibsoni TaxID=33632 RepID=A0AAD8PD50_BABGI|nr:hypothetical protein BgAZ_403840 [Babesia gibsoni]
MGSWQKPSARRDETDEFINEYENECKCEFIDPRFLSITALDSEHAALDYFYQSPFYLKYRENALNEHIRAGKTIDSHEVGLMFQVTYSNLDDIAEKLKQMPAIDDVARLQYYSNASIFHITLFSRTLGQNGVTTTPIKIYYIMQGSIFMCPPFGSLIRLRLHQSIEQFEKFYDRLNDISHWSVASGYSWEPKKKKLSAQIEGLCERYNFSDPDVVNYEKDGNMNIFYLKPPEPLASRIAYDDVRELAKRLEALQNQITPGVTGQNAQNTEHIM